MDEGQAERCEEADLTGPDAIVQAMAVGLVIEVWRNGPVEDMHSSRRGPSDAAMFAESTALQDEAVKALTAKHRDFGLIDFERHPIGPRAAVGWYGGPDPPGTWIRPSRAA